MADRFAKQYNSLGSPYTKSAAVTPSDTVDLAQATQALYVGVSGDIKCTFVGDADNSFVLLKAVPVGLMRHVRIKRIWTVAGSATNIIALS